MRASIHAAAALLLASAAFAQTPRRDVTLFEFGGVRPGSSEAQQYGALHTLLAEKLTTIEQESGVLQTRFLRITNPIPLPTPPNLLDYQKQSRSLTILTGTILPPQPNYYLVSGSLFIGDLRGHLPHDNILFRLQINVDLAGTLEDAFSVVTLYALAMDSLQNKAPRTTVIALLNKAHELQVDVAKAMDDRGIHGRERNDIRDLGNAIEAALSALKAGRTP